MRRIIRHAVAGLGVCAVGTALVAVTWTGGSAEAGSDVRMAVPATYGQAAALATQTPRVLDARAFDAQAVSRDAERTALGYQRAELLTDRQAAVARRSAAIKAERAAEAKRKAVAKKKAEAARKARIKALGYEPGTTDPKSIARQIMANTYGWGDSQFSCYNNIIMRESMWDLHAENASSGAYGIPQALPGSKMAKFGSDWRTNPATQIRWGLDYVKDRYGTPCGAWGFKSSHGWY